MSPDQPISPEADRENRLFADAGKTREVHLETLLDMLPHDTVAKIQKELKMRTILFSMGMYPASTMDALFVRVAGYMGWIPHPDEFEKKEPSA